jgi:Zn-dependent oligopeptidase
MIDWEKFTRVWQESKTLGEVAVAMGIPLATASTYGSRLRRRGVNLKRFRRGGAEMSGERLERLKAIALEVSP